MERKVQCRRQPDRPVSTDHPISFPMRLRPPAVLVAIVGGSGSGKTWLAEQLKLNLGHKAERLSLDDFYQDRSHLSPGRRARVNFDHPRAIDWKAVELALRACSDRSTALVPCYDFSTHCRSHKTRRLGPAPLVIVDGLWLLRSPAMRRFFSLTIYLDCSARIRLQRRLERDVRSRGRSSNSVRQQFHSTVEPMHKRYVAPQSRWADLILSENVRPAEVRALARRIEQLGES